jgi:hypothetical protein
MTTFDDEAAGAPRLAPGQHGVLEDAGVAYDPAGQVLDLSKEEKRRTTALLMAVQAYDKLIIKEADYLAEAARLARNDEGPRLKPATIDAMIDAAFKFDNFIAGVPREDMPRGEDPLGRARRGDHVPDATDMVEEGRSTRRRKGRKP